MVNPIQPDGYLAVPPAGKGPGVLVLQAWWGLNDSIKEFCRRLADAGFVAFAPDLTMARSPGPSRMPKPWRTHLAADTCRRRLSRRRQPCI
jgi:dienelactone hydrolase